MECIFIHVHTLKKSERGENTCDLMYGVGMIMLVIKFKCDFIAIVIFFFCIIIFFSGYLININRLSELAFENMKLNRWDSWGIHVSLESFHDFVIYINMNFFRRLKANFALKQLDDATCTESHFWHYLDLETYYFN